MTATNPGMFDRREYYKEKGVYYELRATTLQITSFRTNPVKDLLYRLRNRMGEVYTTSLPAKESGIVSAMILGDKSLLDIDIRQLYQESGIGHLLAISGLHVSILCMALIRFFKHTGISERIFIPAGIGLVLAYGQMTDFSISTSRAVIMMILLLAADLFERTYDGKNSLAIAAVIILLQKPFALFSCSFLLSFGAMAGIYFIVPFLVQIWSGDSWQKHRRRRQRHFSERALRQPSPDRCRNTFYQTESVDRRRDASDQQRHPAYDTTGDSLLFFRGSPVWNPHQSACDSTCRLTGNSFLSRRSYRMHLSDIWDISFIDSLLAALTIRKALPAF